MADYNSFIPSVFFHDLPFLCSFIISHPLYFSYFIFFSPYLFRFISFISPLFFTTSILLILSLVATTFPQSKLGFVQTMVDKLRSKLNDVDEDDEFLDFEEFEIFKIVFRDQTLMIVGDGEDHEQTVAKSEKERSLERLFEELDRFEDSDSTTAIEKKDVGELQKLGLVTTVSDEDQNFNENLFSVKLNPWQLDSSSSFGSCVSIGDTPTANERESYIEGAGELEKLEPVTVSSSGEDKNTVQNSFFVKSISTAYIETKENETGSYIEEVAGELQKLAPVKVPARNVKSNSTAEKETGSHVRGILQKLEMPAIAVSGYDQKSIQNSSSQTSNSWRSDSSSSFGSYGSMRKEKEWKRTLACKLFEERNNSSGGEEGMDSLWEAYEDDNANRKSKNRKQSIINEKKTMIKNKKSCSEFNEDDDDEDEFMNNDQLCCLKALKLSTGKMNLGMGKPNLVKISKALKGFGWIHHVGSKHGKKH